MENSNLATNNLNEPLRSDDKSPVSLNSNVKWKDNIEHELIEEDIIPYVGMQFDTEDHAYRFYNVYAGFAGFSIRRDWRNKSKLDNKTVMSRKFVCFKEGFKRTKDDYDEKVSRKDIRTGCLAHVVIGRELSGKYVVTSFEKDHNHELASPRSKHKLPSQRRVSAAQAAENALKNLNHVFKRSDSFAKDLRSCIYDFEYEDDFLTAWNSLLDKHNLHQNKWMQDFYKKKEKWALVYGRNTFSAGATSTQLSESFNGRLRLYMKSTYNVLEFFRHFERLIEDMRYKEIESNYEMSQKMPSLNMNIMLLKTARDVYTPTIFSLVRGEYEKSCNLLLNNCTKNLQLYEYEVSFFGDMRQHKVTFNSEDQSVDCSCRLFQFIGILCCHALRVLNHLNIIVIPQKYILKRWTKQARSGCVLDSKGQIIKEDPKLVVSNRLKDLCRTAVGISSKAAESGEASAFLARILMEADIEVDKILSKRSSTQTTNLGDVNSQTNEIITDDIVIASQAMGIKKKDGTSRLKGRPKSCVEKKYKRSKGTQKCNSMSQNYSTIMPIMQNFPFSHKYQDLATAGINTTQSNDKNMENEEHKEEFGVSTYAYEGQEHLSQSLMLNSTNVELEAPSAELQPSYSEFSLHDGLTSWDGTKTIN
ncbi:protein FAR1-RELATED SEQUENCE [Trifolium repens]|nr:protein FAR1-RELATED SEQUENCE [Trifolium repens]